MLCNDLLEDGELSKNTFYFYIFFFFWFSNMIFIGCVDFTRIEASKTASDDVTN